jgi:hypothetical protein
VSGAARFRTRATPTALRKQARERHERMLRDTVRLLIEQHDQATIDHARAVLAATTPQQRDMIGESTLPDIHREVPRASSHSLLQRLPAPLYMEGAMEQTP